MTIRAWPAMRYRTLGRGVFHCERCGGDRPYRHLRARRPRVRQPGEHLRCAVCGTCYRVELLAVPTTGQMLDALLAGTTAAVLAMLAAGDQPGEAARLRAVEVIRGAGAPDYDLARLSQALEQAGLEQARPEQAKPDHAEPGRAVRLRPAIEAFALQLEIPARGWFLASVVQVGLAEGSLSGGQREVAGFIARYLGLTQAMARAVITATEEAAQAG